MAAPLSPVANGTAPRHVRPDSIVGVQPLATQEPPRRRTDEDDLRATCDLRRFALQNLAETGATLAPPAPSPPGVRCDNNTEPDRKPRNRLFTKAIDYRTYRLRNKGNGRFSSRDAVDLSDIRKQIEGIKTPEKVAGKDSIVLLPLLFGFKQACHDCDIS